VDETVCDVAEQVAARFSRRSILHNLAAGVAAVVGVKFAAPHVVDTLIRMPQAEGAPVPQAGGGGGGGAGGGGKIICNHDEKSPCSLAGRQCGMGNLVDCAAYKREDTSKGKCRNCMGNKGCPKGTVRGPVQWQACCKCIDNPTHPGHIFDYWDCCGTVAKLDPACKTAACEGAVADSGCNNPAGCNVPAEGNPWCGEGGGLAICTIASDTRNNCKS